MEQDLVPHDGNTLNQKSYCFKIVRYASLECFVVVFPCEGYFSFLKVVGVEYFRSRVISFEWFIKWRGIFEGYFHPFQIVLSYLVQMDISIRILTPSYLLSFSYKKSKWDFDSYISLTHNKIFFWLNRPYRHEENSLTRNKNNNNDHNKWI